MTHDQAFLQAIQEDPDDDTPRLVYADWLEEQGGSDGADRAEFIRTQVELARLTDDDPRCATLEGRAAALLARHAQAWAGPMPEWVSGWEFHRGFLSVLRIDGGKFLARALAGYVSVPSQRQVLRRVGRLLDEAAAVFPLRLVQQVRLADLPGWWVSGLDVGLGAAQAFLHSPYLAGLRQLDLSGNHLGNGGMEVLTSLLEPLRLRALNLSGNALFRVEGVRALAHSAAVARLCTLELAGNLLGPAGVRALLAGPHSVQWSVLNLDTSEVGDEGVQTLAAARDLAGLTRLNLNNNRIGDDGARALAGSPYLGQLTELALLNNWSISTGQRLVLRKRFGDRVRL
jgi:uncharacterized protein (TIGR02996 family)